jgi:hypothetical protein
MHQAIYKTLGLVMAIVSPSCAWLLAKTSSPQEQLTTEHTRPSLPSPPPLQHNLPSQSNTYSTVRATLDQIRHQLDGSVVGEFEGALHEFST